MSRVWRGLQTQQPRAVMSDAGMEAGSQQPVLDLSSDSVNAVI